jgi:hypothetical protein
MICACAGDSAGWSSSADCIKEGEREESALDLNDDGWKCC